MKSTAVRPLSIASIFAVVGLLALLIVSANSASDRVNFEAEEAGEIESVADAAASGGRYALFKDQIPPFSFSTYKNSQAFPIEQELNVASNGIWSWSAPVATNGADRYTVTFRAPTPIEKDFYWASVFDFSNVSHGGYIGLQNKVHILSGQPRGAIFSIWNTTVAEAVDDGVAQPFSGEGVGMQTARAINWEWNTQFEFIIERDSARSDGSYNWWRGFVINKALGGGIEVGRIRTPAAWGYPIPKYTFIERIGGPNVCGGIDSTHGEFTQVQARADGIVYEPNSVNVEIREYTNCIDVLFAQEILGQKGYSVKTQAGVPR